MRAVNIGKFVFTVRPPQYAIIPEKKIVLCLDFFKPYCHYLHVAFHSSAEPIVELHRDFVEKIDLTTAGKEPAVTTAAQGEPCP